MVLNYIGTFNITTFLGIFSEKRGNFDLSRRNWNMQALRKEENLVFYRTINGVSTRTEVTRDEMDSLINKEIMAREFLVKVIKEKFERWARDSYICSKNKIFAGANQDGTIYYFTSECPMVRRVDSCYKSEILHVAYSLAREYGICATCIHQNDMVSYEFWIGSK